MSVEFPNEYHLTVPWFPEDCPCPKLPCGHVAVSQITDGCVQHDPIHQVSIRKGHRASECPLTAVVR